MTSELLETARRANADIHPLAYEIAMPTRTPAPSSVAPRLALVLGSGGVRSIAALGMVEVLAREQLMPDLLVGCSAGAMFGALIALGHSADEAVRIATTLWSADVTRKRRWRAIPQMLFPHTGGFDADFALRDDEPVMQRLQQAFGDVQIEDLCLPLRVTTTDAATGERVVLRRGPLVQALRASIALPFMFSPVHIGGRRLIDGFIADPLPVSAADDAQAVLALGFESPMPRRIDGPSRLLAQMTSAMTNNLMQARLAASGTSGPRLLSLIPRLTRRVGLFDTQAMPYLVDAGRQAATENLSAIRALLLQRSRLEAA
jgi:NTE family protein